jgi:hypothetical protein
VKLSPLADILRKIRPLAQMHQAAYLRSMIVKEQTDGNGKFNLHRTSVRIRELQAALQDIQMRRLKREKAA